MSICAAGLGELGGIVQDVGQDLDEANTIAIDHQCLGRNARGDAVFLDLDRFTAGLQGVGDDVSNVNRFATQRDPAHRQARNVQEVVDQPDEMLDLALHRLPHLGPDLQILRPRLDREGVTDGCERVAQLVREHRQELVLAAVSLAQRFFGSPFVVHVHDGSVPLRDRAGRVAVR